jgi:hypothetical protein
VLTFSQARELAAGFARAVTEGGPADWSAGAARLSEFDGRLWLVVDEAARSHTYGTGTPVSGTRGWLADSVSEPTGFVAVVTSLHADGRIRQRATRVLARGTGRLWPWGLALRTIDHVPAVRAEALQGLLPRLDADAAEPVLAVLLAGRRRQHAAAALDSVRASLLMRLPPSELATSLFSSEFREVRRWAFEFAHQHGLLTVDRLVAAVQSERDQLLRASCARWLVDVASPTQLRTLLHARSVDARLTALTYLPDEELTDEVLLPLMADRAARVRTTARWRARRRSVDVAGWYRAQLAARKGSPSFVAACLDGLSVVGSAGDLDVFLGALGAASPTVRSAAVTGVGALGEREQTCAVLDRLLLDSSPRVSSKAARVLARAGAGPARARGCRLGVTPALEPTGRLVTDPSHRQLEPR